MRKEKIHGFTKSLTIFKQLFKNIWGTLLISILIVIFLEIIEHFIVFTFFPNIKVYLYDNGTLSLISFWETIHFRQDSYDTLLGTVAGVSGVFLGLYFTAISVIAGSMASNVSVILIEQLVREKTGNFYVKTLATLISVSLALLCFSSLGGKPGILNLAFIFLDSSFGVLSFIVLGRGVFYFFDYGKLSKQIYADIDKNIRLATVKGYAWDDQNFQSHYQKETSKQLSVIKEIVESLLRKMERESSPLLEVIHDLQSFLLIYQAQKRSIPTKSKWYVNQPSHKNWFLASDTEITRALQTQVGIQPNLIPNSFWFEECIIETIQISLADILNANDTKTANKIVQHLGSILEYLGEELANEASDKILSMVETEISSFLNKQSKDSANRANQDNGGLLLLDLLGFLHLAYALGLFKTGRETTKTRMENNLDKINWTDKYSIYSQSFSSSILIHLEKINETLSFEKESEGKVITPAWYSKQLVVIEYINQFSAGLTRVLNTLENNFTLKCQKFNEQEYYLLSTQHASRGLEICNKFSFNLTSIQENINSFEQYRILKENDFKWPNLEIENLVSRLENIREKLIEITVECLPFLSQIKRDDYFPDYFGQAYITVYAEAHKFLYSEKSNSFSKLFPILFNTALSAYDSLRSDENLKKTDVKTQIIFSSEPLFDIIELSGFAKIYSELYSDNKMWEVCERCWNSFLDKNPKPSDLIIFFVNNYEYRKSLYQLNPRDVLRTNWMTRLNQKMSAMNLIDERDDRFDFSDVSYQPNHQSPLIRALCSDTNSFGINNSAIEIFFFIYLLNRPEALSNQIIIKDPYGFISRFNKEKRKG